MYFVGLYFLWGLNFSLCWSTNHISSVHRFVWPLAQTVEAKVMTLHWHSIWTHQLLENCFSLTIQRPNSISGDQLVQFLLHFENIRRVNKTLNKNGNCVTSQSCQTMSKNSFRRCHKCNLEYDSTSVCHIICLKCIQKLILVNILGENWHFHNSHHIFLPWKNTSKLYICPIRFKDSSCWCLRKGNYCQWFILEPKWDGICLWQMSTSILTRNNDGKKCNSIPSFVRPSLPNTPLSNTCMLTLLLTPTC